MRQVHRAVGVSLLLAAFSATSAQAALPEWPGEWEVVGLKAGASGVVETPVPDIIRDFGGNPPFTPEAAAKFQAFLKALESQDNPVHQTCTFGFPTIMLESPLYFEVLITPHETVMIFSGREIRHIYTDGRAQPPADELFPTHWGSSVGHWDGQTLVIDTLATGENIGGNLVFIWNAADFFRPLALLSEQTHYVERIRMLSAGLLEDQMTIYDSQFAKPWRITHRYQHVRGVTRMIHEDCEGNDRNPIVNGKWTLK